MRRPFDAPSEPVAYARWNYGDVIPEDELDEIIEGALKSWVNRDISLEEIIDRRVFALLIKDVDELIKEITKDE